MARASITNTLRRSSLEIERGIAGKKIFTMSAAGFSALKVMRRAWWGRIIDTSNIMIEVDSRGPHPQACQRPDEVSAMIGEVMTTPMVRIASQGPVMVESGSERKARKS